MKKEYISPAAVVVEFDGEALMYEATSTAYTNDVFSRRKEQSDAGIDSEDWEDWEEE